MTDIIFISLTPVAVLILELLHRYERRDLYNRLMAKSLPELTAYEESQKAKVQSPKKTELVQL